MIAIIHGPSQQALTALQKELTEFRFHKAQQYIRQLQLSSETKQILMLELQAHLIKE